MLRSKASLLSVFRLPRLAHIWLPDYLRSTVNSIRSRRHRRGLTHILLCVADHFEPAHGGVPAQLERERVTRWAEQFPGVARRFADADGRPPQHTFFYPLEQYNPECLDVLAQLVDDGFGEVEIHLHHDNDTSDHLRESLESFRDTLFHRHGLLAIDRDGRIGYGFVHGNWTLDNSHPEGRWCGVNDELTILRETGCYADFTMPSAPEVGQTRTVNSIYYAIDDIHRPKSHDRGIPVQVGMAAPPDGLLMVQGPLGLDWHRRKWRVLPGLENAAADASNPPSARRFAQWVSTGIGVAGRPEWVFIKIHTHGAIDENASLFLGPAMVDFHQSLSRTFNDGERYCLHYVTAREVANVIKAAEAGRTGNPGHFRDFNWKRARGLSTSDRCAGAP